MFDWNDLKAFLAVAREGSTLAASRVLGVNQTTVARRIEALEAALSLKLFDRGQAGSRLTEAGEDLVAEAERVERMAERFASRAAGHRRGLSGVLRITTSDIIANTMVMPALAEFRELYPDVQIDLVVTDRSLDIEAGEADVAIRSGRSLPESDLMARKIAEHDFALYCSRAYAARRGAPESPGALRDHDLIGAEGSMGEMAGVTWMLAQAGGKTPVTRSNSVTNMIHAVKAGLGVGVLPTAYADLERDLVRCSEDIPSARSASWIVVRREMKDTPRVRAFIDFMAPFVHRHLRRVEVRVRERQAAEIG